MDALITSLRLIAILLSLFGSDAFAQSYLRLFYMPSSPVRIEWDSPAALVDSTISAGFNNRNHPISHVNVEFFCAHRGVRVFTGAVSKDKSQSTKLLFQENIGLSIMAGAWAGRLEEISEIHDSLTYRGSRRDMLSAVTFTISDAACDRLTQYHRETELNAATRLYGFAARPRRHEGAGCSAFAASYAEVAGVLTAAMEKEWVRSMKVPLSLMTVLGSVPAITPREIMDHADGAQWASGNQPHMNITLFDPDLSHEWIVRLAGSANERAAFGAELDGSLTASYPKIVAIKIDAARAPVPGDALFAAPRTLREMRPGFFVRSDLTFEASGSFTMGPF